ENDPKVFGHQYGVDAEEKILFEEPYLLINATDIPFDGVEAPVKERGGVMIPAHLDKSTTSLLSSLGYVPPESTFTIFELKNMSKLHELRQAHPYLQKCRVITDSDAHYLEHINEPVNFLNVEEKSVKGVIGELSKPIATG
ncbi:MAG: phosphoesterase, partial [Lachnospiraceae bacterium]|nr:phosphoesterase [Lachnospiraceae bacterium]